MASKVEEMVKEIEDAAERISSVNADNIDELFEFYNIDKNDSEEEIIEQLKECDIKATKTAIKLIKKYNISLYSPFQHVGLLDEEQELLKSKTEKEFMSNLQKYSEIMKWWADQEEEAASDSILSEIHHNIPESVEYVAVAYQYWYGCTSLAGHSFVAAVYYSEKAKTKEELQRLLEKKNIQYDEIITKDELAKRMMDDLKYINELGEGCWGTPHTQYINVDLE